MVSIFLLAILTIGAVSAADDNITDTTDDVLSVESVDNNELEVSKGDFAELSNLVENTAGGKTLKLEKDYVNDKSTKNPININNRITIDGQGHTINANKKTSIFVANNKNIVLKNINFINSYGNDGAILSNFKDCTIINCSFNNCGSYGSGGGAINQANAYDCTFIKCTSSADYCYGGAISYGNAYNCSFDNCYVIDEAKGGAIGYGNAYNSSFVKCNSWEYGGAIYKGNAFYCSFVDCYASDDNGGAIAEGNATNCYFENCRTGGSGGAIYDGNAYNCTFMKCHDGSELGGAIFDGDAYDSSFIGCTGFMGGAISRGDASNCLFINCSGDLGGAIEGGSASACLFINCSAGEGGAINYGSAEDCLFINCSAKRHGGVIDEGSATDSYCVNCHDAYNDELTYPTAWSEENYNEGSYALKSDSPFIYGYAASYSTNPSKVIAVATLASNATGNVKFTINGVTKKVKIANGVARTYFTGLTAGKYTFDVTYSGDDKYPADSISTFIEIDKTDAITSVSAKDVEYGRDAVVTIKVNKNAPGKLDVTLNNITQKVKINASTLKVKFTGLKIGSYNVTVSYPGNDQFKAQNITANFSVVKATPISSVNVTNPVGFGDDAVIIVNMSNNQINGNIWFTLSDANKTKLLTDKIHIENGVAAFNFRNIALGKYYLHLYYAGNAHYKAQTIKKTFNVVKKTPIVSVNVTPYYGQTTIEVKVNNVNGNVWFTISDENKTKILTDKMHIENGTATRFLPDLAVGKYYLHVYYAGNVHYSNQTIKSTFVVDKKTPMSSVDISNKGIGEDLNITVNMFDNKVNGNVWVTVTHEGKTTKEKAQIKNGTVFYSIQKPALGNYRLTLHYSGNTYYKAQTLNQNVVMYKSNANIKVTKTTEGGRTILNVKLPKYADGKVKIEVNGKTYNIELTDGLARLGLSLPAGNYTVKTTYDGNDKVYSGSNSRTITIK